MMDSGSGQVLSSVPIDEEIDAAAFDGASKLAFTSNGEGTVTIAHEDSISKLSVVQILKTAEGARTMALDSKTHNIYLSVATRQGSAPGSGQAGRAVVRLPMLESPVWERHRLVAAQWWQIVSGCWYTHRASEVVVDLYSLRNEFAWCESLI